VSDRFQTALLIVALLVAGALSWTLALRPSLDVDTSPLGELPARIGDWRSEDVPLDAKEAAILRASYNLQRFYARPVDAGIWLYIGYYGTERGGRPEHTPDLCYPATGWRIERESRIVVDPATGMRANEYLAEKDGHRELVLFWYRSYRQTGLLGVLGQTLDRAAGRLVDGRADGALVRLSTTLGTGSEAAARERLVGFATALEPLLGSHWPVEAAQDAGAEVVREAPAGR
jgi:EpsI family protein